jgi:hypothetical protein
MQSLEGLFPESWLCVDCGMNTAPGMLGRAEMEAAFAAAEASGKDGIKQTFDDRTEVYTVREAIWKACGMEPDGGCLCIGCLERRIGRALRPKDFRRNHPFNTMPGTERLLKRQKRA